MQNDTADAIAAVGGVQITLHTREEVREVAEKASALAVNVGTLDEAWMACAREAIPTVANRDVPWVLDPVAVGFTRYRTDAVHELLRLHPTVLKGNASEILTLAGAVGGGRGADSIHSVGDAAEAAQRLARDHRCLIVVSGAEDLITDGRRSARIANGAPMMARMIGSGCMLTSILACFLAVADDPFEASQAAVAYFTVAGEIAAERADGPGTLKPLLIDALYNLDATEFQRRARITEEDNVRA